MTAGESPQPTIEPACEALRPVLGGKIGGEVADEPGEIAMGDDRRRLADERRAGAEGLDDEAEPGQLLAVRLDQRRRVRVEVDHQRRQKRLPLDPDPLALALELFIDDPLVRRMLVDDDEPVRGLGDDVVPVHLRPRRPRGAAKSRSLASTAGTGAAGAKAAKLACAGSENPLASLPARSGAAGEARQSHPTGGVAGRKGWGGRMARNRRRAAGRRGPVQGFAEPLLDRPDQETAHEPEFAEAHLGFGGVDVDVDLAGVASNEKGCDRVPIGGQKTR